jgi:hypothetical protein
MKLISLMLVYSIYEAISLSRTKLWKVASATSSALPAHTPFLDLELHVVYQYSLTCGNAPERSGNSTGPTWHFLKSLPGREQRISRDLRGDYECEGEL